jgi:hypothetical protein
MPVSVHATITGDKEWLRKLVMLSPQKHKEILEDALLACGMLVQANAKREQIIRGGQKVKGVQSKPHPSRLTSRTGTLRSSISTSWHRSPFELDVGTFETGVGTKMKYGRAHELGFRGTVAVPSHWREIRQAFGKPIAPRSTKIKAHSRQMKLPKRPFLKPAVKAVESQFPSIFMRWWRKHSGE